ncbi:MAG: aldo/keto reductase [Acidobacteria bacterium]|nr:aldo/keto reductase [Acidobacteriota bacterium]
MHVGHASPSGTARFRSRFPSLAEAGHFRKPEHVRYLSELWLSSIGIGTYLGEPDTVTDERYSEAVLEALRLGVNVIDSAINYRLQRSERSIGSALKQALSSGDVQREELVICTKAGYLTYDGTVPADPRRYFIEEYIDTEVAPRDQLVGGMHCMAPSYLHNQLERSRRNLGIETIDVFYIHNPEQQLAEVPRDVFYKRLRQAFIALEEEAANDTIRVYGTATWNGFRQNRDSGEFLDLERMVSIASEVAGELHHFRAIQLPFNLALPEAFTSDNQAIGGKPMSLLAAAQELGICVFTSAALLQGRLTARLPEFVRETFHCDSDASAAIQFARSAAGVTTALVGMSRREHVQGNLEVAGQPLAKPADWQGLFQASR